MKYYLTLFLLILVFISCEKEITVDLPNPEEKIVVEGHIEPGSFPYVLLSVNAAYFAPTDLNAYQQYLVKNAVVTITDGTVTDTLHELIPGYGYFYAAKSLTGTIGKTYSISISAKGKTIYGNTSITVPVPLDSLWFKTIPGNDSLGYLYAHLSEPAGPGNYYRIFAKRMGKDDDFIPPFGSVFDDKFIDGQSFEFSFSRGSEPNSTKPDDNNEEEGYFKAGDTVIVKFCTLDKEGFEFYRSFETELYSNGNPFAAPSNIKSNLKPDKNVLGVFCGYGVWTDTLILK